MVKNSNKAKRGENMLLFFSCLMILFFIFLFFLRFGKIQVKLEDFEKDHFRKKQKDLSTLKIGLLLTDRLKILEICMKEKGRIPHRKAWIQMKDLARKKGWTKKWKREVKELSKEDQKEILEHLWKERNIQLKIRKLNLLLRIGVEDVILTSYLVSILSMLTSILLSCIGKEKWREDYHYLFYPSYQGKFDYQLRLDITVQMSLWQILQIIWWLYRWEKARQKATKEVIVPG